MRRTALLLGFGLLVGSAVWAQTPQTPGAAAPATATAPQPGRGPGGPGGAGTGPGARWGSKYTAGWAMMTPQERAEHRAKMQAMNSYEECKAYQEQHHQLMAERAKAKGLKSLPQPRRDACIGLKK